MSISQHLLQKYFHLQMPALLTELRSSLNFFKFCGNIAFLFTQHKRLLLFWDCKGRNNFLFCKSFYKNISKKIFQLLEEALIILCRIRLKALILPD